MKPSCRGEKKKNDIGADMGVLGKPFVSRLNMERSSLGAAMKSEAQFGLDVDVELPYNSDMGCNLALEGHKTVYPLTCKCLSSAMNELRGVWDHPMRNYGVVTMAMGYGDAEEKKYGLALDAATFHEIFSRRKELKKELQDLAKEKAEEWNKSWGGPEHVMKREKFESEHPLRELVTLSYGKPVVNKLYISLTNFFSLAELQKEAQVAIDEECVMFCIRYQKESSKGGPGKFMGQKLYLPYGTMMAFLESEELGKAVEDTAAFLDSLPKEADVEEERNWFFRKEGEQSEEEARAELKRRVQSKKKNAKRARRE